MGKRVVSFILGFLFGIIFLVGGVAGVGFWAYKNLDLATLQKWGWVDSSQFLEDDSDLKNLPIEGLIKEMIGLGSGGADTSINALVAKYKIKLPDDIKKYIPEAAMNLPIKTLTGSDGLNAILAGTNLDYVFQFLPEGALSPNLTKALGNKSLKSLMSGDIAGLTEGLYVGYLLEGIEFETDADGETVFTDVVVGTGESAHTVRRPVVIHKEGGDAAMETLATLEVKRLLDGLTDANGVGLLGVLAEDIGDKDLTELLPLDSSEALIDTLLGDKKIGDLIVKLADGKYSFSADAMTQNVYVGQLMGYKRGEQKTDADGHPVTDEQGNPKYDWASGEGASAKTLSGIEDSLANIKLADLTEGNFSMESAVNGLYIGEVMGYVKGEAKPENAKKFDWYAKADGGARGERISGIEEAIANMSMSGLLGGGFSMDDALDGMYVGDLMKYVKGDQIVSANPSDAVKYEWFVKSPDGTLARAESMEEAVANILASDLIGGNFEITDSFDGMYVGELMKYAKGDAKPSADPNTPSKYDWYVKNADGSNGARISGVEEAIANIAMKELLGGNFNVDQVFDGMYVGEVMGYTKDGLQADLQDEYYWVSDDRRVGALNTALANIKMSELLAGKFDASSMINKLTLGDVMGYALVDGVWQDADGAAVTGIIGALAGKTVKQIPDAIDTMKIGEVMNMKEIDGTWYAVDANGAYTHPASGIMKVFADLTVKEMQNPDTLTQKIQNDLTLADALGYQEQNGHWVDSNGVRVSGIMSALAGKRVGELSTAVNDTELGVVLGYENIGGVWYAADADGNFTIPATGVIKALAGTKIDGLDSALQNMEIGKIMGMEFRAPSSDPSGAAVWCKESVAGSGIWVAADSLSVKFASKKLNELNGDTFKDIVDGLTVNEIFTGEKSGILLLLKDNPDTPEDESNPKVTDLPTVLAGSVTGATMGDLVTVGIITEGAGGMAATLSSISAKLYMTQPNPAEHWKTRTMAEFFADVNKLLAMIP